MKCKVIEEWEDEEGRVRGRKRNSEGERGRRGGLEGGKGIVKVRG